MKRSIRNSRNNNGSAVSEFGASLVAFFFFAFIPVVNIVSLIVAVVAVEYVTYNCADTISKANDTRSLSEALASMNQKLVTGDALPIVNLEATRHPLSVSLSVQNIKDPRSERNYDIKDAGLIKLNRSTDLIHYRVSASYKATPFFDLSAIPVIGSVPVIAGPIFVEKTLYREIEHPEFLLNTQDSLHAQFTKASR